MQGFPICLIILYIWQGFEYASSNIYSKVMNMQWCYYNNIIITVTSAIILEL